MLKKIYNTINKFLTEITDEIRLGKRINDVQVKRLIKRKRISK